MAQLGLSNGAAIPHAHTNPNGSAHLSKSGKAGGSSEKKPALSTEERRIQRQARAQAAALKRQIQPSRRSGRVAAMASKADYTGYVLNPVHLRSGKKRTTQRITASHPKAIGGLDLA